MSMTPISTPSTIEGVTDWVHSQKPRMGGDFDMATCYEWAVEFYNKRFAEESAVLRTEMAAIDAELEQDRCGTHPGVRCRL